mmetsp:Transcript_21254/g.40001  ORF Transcript_21254/g.40001 Transcript_21254/m.40001 type:complete len:317 (-) Transcript_21254:223-1173(-)
MALPCTCSCSCGWFPPLQTEGAPADAWWKEAIRHETDNRWYVRQLPGSWAATFGGSQVDELIKHQVEAPSDRSFRPYGRRVLSEPRESDECKKVMRWVDQPDPREVREVVPRLGRAVQAPVEAATQTWTEPVTAVLQPERDLGQRMPQASFPTAPEPDDREATLVPDGLQTYPSDPHMLAPCSGVPCEKTPQVLPAKGRAQKEGVGKIRDRLKGRQKEAEDKWITRQKPRLGRWSVLHQTSLPKPTELEGAAPRVAFVNAGGEPVAFQPPPRRTAQQPGHGARTPSGEWSCSAAKMKAPPGSKARSSSAPGTMRLR